MRRHVLQCGHANESILLITKKCLPRGFSPPNVKFDKKARHKRKEGSVTANMNEKKEKGRLSVGRDLK